MTAVAVQAAGRLPETANVPMTMPATNRITSVDTTRTTLSDVPNVSTAQFLSGSGTRSITLLPTAMTGDTAPSMPPTSSSPAASPAPVATTPTTAPRALSDHVPYDRSPMSTGLPDSLAAMVAAAVHSVDSPTDEKLAREMLESALGLIGDRPDTLDLKIAAAALAEMREAFSVFAPYRDVPKVTVFGSARTATNDPLYAQATEIAKLLAAQGWMVVTGAGPGIMQAAMEGAGRERSIGVSIRLPFEQGANPVIAGDEKYVSMKYFFTRKLILVKESRAFVCLPGGFGTLDETFELLTLTQTGKGLPVPIIFLDMAGDPFWESVDQLVRDQLVSRNLVSAADTHLYYVTDSCEDACREIERFYANYDSIRYVGNQAIIRLRSAPSDEQLALLNGEFAHLVSSGRIECTAPLPVEVRQADRLDLPRLRFQFAKHKYGDLRAMIDVLNSFVMD